MWCELWLANCYFAHDSLGCPVLLPFFDAPCGVITEGEDQIQPVTWYPNSYATLTLSGDGKTLATVETKTMQNLYPPPVAGRPRRTHCFRMERMFLGLTGPQMEI